MISVMFWWCLRMHAGYLCRHSGVCCRTEWEIPAETQVIRAIELSSLRHSEAGRALTANAEHAVELHVPRDDAGACLFFNASKAGSCAVHSVAGPEALPSACRHFPREFLVDGRGTLVSLSHYCPTAASLLTFPDALDVVDGAPLRIGGEIEGLDATAALPPLLRPGVLTDIDGYSAWEFACLALLSREEIGAREALDRIERITEAVRTWQPGDGTLLEAVRQRQAAPNGGNSGRRRSHGSTLAPLVAQHVSEEWLPVADYEGTWQPLVEGVPAVERVVKNYLGARLFANWIAYQGRGLRTVVEWLHACHAVVRNELALRVMRERRPADVADATAAAGRADLLLIHTISSQQFADFYIDREQT